MTVELRASPPEEQAFGAAHPAAAAWAEQLHQQAVCGQRPEGHRWQMEIENGDVSVNCADCHANPGSDYTEILSMPPVPVSIKWETHHYHTPDTWPGSCDCDHYLNITLMGDQ